MDALAEGAVSTFPRCAGCGATIVPDEFHGRDAAGRAICTLCEEAQARETVSQRLRFVAALVASILALAALVIVYGGCQSLPPVNPGDEPFRGARTNEWGQPVDPPSHTNRPWRDRTNDVPLRERAP